MHVHDPRLSEFERIVRAISEKRIPATAAEILGTSTEAERVAVLEKMVRGILTDAGQVKVDDPTLQRMLLKLANG